MKKPTAVPFDDENRQRSLIQSTLAEKAIDSL